MNISKFSNRQKNYAFVVIAVAAIVGISLEMDNTQQPDQIESRTQALNSNSPQTYLDAPVTMATVSAVVPESYIQKNSIAEKALSTAKSTPPESGWIIGDVKASTPTIPLNERIAQYEIVRVDRPETYPAVGQTISLPMFNGKNVSVNVQSATTLQNGDYTWSGHLDGFGDDYPVVMTYGEHSIFATITTPNGAYTMESTDGAGWLYKNPSEFELSNPGFKDYLEVTDR